MKHPILEILLRDLQKLSEEISSYPDEALIWKTADGISNSAGNLCLHLCGNIRHFIGGVLGGSGYIRNREAEFSLKNIPREKLLAGIEDAKHSVEEAFQKLTLEKLKENYPVNVLGTVQTTEFFLIHLVAHLNYHLGQVNYHRRLVNYTSRV